LGPIQSIKTCIAKSFDYSGRTERAAFWWFVLAILLMAPVVGLLDYAMFGKGTYVALRQGGQFRFQINAQGWFTALFVLLSILPFVAAMVRRMHDIDKSGYYLLSPFAAMLFALIVGSIMFGLFGQSQGSASLVYGAPALIITYAALPVLFSITALSWWLSSPSQLGPNRYGPNPLEVTP
jgi:uncharacterized membrane protein YhaH (DUF805 family)